MRNITSGLSLKNILMRVSGSTKQRDGLERMLKDAMQRKFDMVATIELSILVEV